MYIHEGWPFALWAGRDQLRKKRIKEKRRPTDHPSNQNSVPLTVRPVLLRRKSYNVLRATILSPFKAHTKETSKQVALPKAAPPLLWWRPKAAPFVCALNGASILALSTIYDLRISETGRNVSRTDFRLDGWAVGRRFPLSNSFSRVHAYA